jgi:hypothetical protein
MARGSIARRITRLSLLAAPAAACILLLTLGADPAAAQQASNPSHSASARVVSRQDPRAPAVGIKDVDKQCFNVASGPTQGTICVMLHVDQHIRGAEFWSKVTFDDKSGLLFKVTIAKLYLLVCSTDPITGSTSCNPENTETNLVKRPAGTSSTSIQQSTGYVPTPGVPISIGGAIAISSCLQSTTGGPACFLGWGCSSATPRIECRTDPLIFSDTLAEFQAARNKACAGDLPDCESHGDTHGAHLDWSSDGCSLPLPVKKYGQNPFGWPYRQACERHDFGYRNYREQGRCTNSPNGGTRKQLDQVFLADLRGICANVKAKKRCNALALVYYNAVRKFGNCK